MRYKSNLSVPDLRPYFKLLDPPMQHAGHDEPSDPDFLPNCGFHTDDECAILYNVAKSVPPGTWVDIGARLGWTAAHVAEAGQHVVLVDPELRFSNFSERMERNMDRWWPSVAAVWAREWGMTAERLDPTARFDGFVIDGCHDSPEPLNDARGAMAHAKPDCLIMFHDFQGPAVRDGVRYLMDHDDQCPRVTGWDFSDLEGEGSSSQNLDPLQPCTCGRGWRCRVYWTPNQVACCWRGLDGSDVPTGMAWCPPDHTPDPAINWASHKAQMVDFADYWERCE